MSRANRLGWLGLVVITIIGGWLPAASAKALSQDQSSVFDSGIYYYNTEVGSGQSTDSSNNCADDINLSGSDNQQKAFNFLMGKSLTAVQAAAIVGNWIQESNVNPTDVNPTSGAYGIAQWLGGRLDNLKSYAQSQNGDYSDLGIQLRFVWQELTTSYNDSVLTPLKKITGDTPDDLSNAVELVLKNYEVPCQTNDNTCWDSEMSKRLPDARGVIKNYGGSDNGSIDTTSTGCGDGGAAGGTISGSGSGQFTTNTDAPAYHGLAQMLARVKQVSQTAAGPLPPATLQFCDSIGGCALHCESAVEEIWLTHRGVYSNPYSNPPNGQSAWERIPAADKHPGDRNPPVGALLIYTAPTDKLGHIAVYLGNNQVFSTDVLGSGSVYIASADKIESAGWGMTYVGWADPYFNGKVGNQGQ